MNNFTREVKKVLQANNCYFHRNGKGDHEIWYSPITHRCFPVDGKIKSRGLANAVMKQAGLKKQF